MAFIANLGSLKVKANAIRGIILISLVGGLPQGVRSAPCGKEAGHVAQPHTSIYPQAIRRDDHCLSSAGDVLLR